ncbi:SPOR domain-containing protein [Kangiella sp.]|uniref:SPOR domain-containing protein n=1 Tax=Kangiella sp. TaxID=1920245 RepID=UPI003A958AAB
MSLNSPLKRTLPALSLTLLITSCASTSNLDPDNSENNDYWYCAPGDQRTWRCAEEKESLGLSYYRFWKTTLDPEAEQFESEESKQTADDPIMVQGAKVSVVEEVSPEVADEAEDEAADMPEEPLSQQRIEQPAAKTKPTYAQYEKHGKYGKVLQLAAYHSQSQARSFTDSLDEKLSQKPNLIRTRVSGQIYYTVVFDLLSSQQEAEQLTAELAELFPTMQPWLRSRAGFEALRAD